MTVNALPSPLHADFLQSALDWQRVFLDTCLQAQSDQYRILAACQNSFGAFSRDLSDQWICRFGGGVPLDG
jgi:hypothetical protein